MAQSELKCYLFSTSTKLFVEVKGGAQVERRDWLGFKTKLRLRLSTLLQYYLNTNEPHGSHPNIIQYNGLI
jgi:hypothetical protein